MWEALFDRELDAELAESVLAGDMMCKYTIYLPDEIIKKYTQTMQETQVGMK